MQPILIYIPVSDSSSTSLLNSIEVLIQDTSYAVIRDCLSFDMALVRSVTTPDLVFLYIPNQKELTHILAIKDRLFGSDVIVVLPNQQPDEVACAHSLRPRFIGYLDDDHALIVDVFARYLREVSGGKSVAGNHVVEKIMIGGEKHVPA